MPETLGTLLKSSWSFWRGHLQPIMVGAAFLALAITLAQMLLFQKMINERVSTMVGDSAKIEKIAIRAAQGDEEAFTDMMEIMGIGETLEDLEGTARNFMYRIAPKLALSVLFTLLISVMGSAYFLILGVRNGQHPQEIAQQVPQYLLPILGVWAWSFLRSFAWIPMLGFVFSIILGPRFFFAGVILIEEGKGVSQSVSESYERSRGYWGKIVGNVTVMSLCTFIAMLVAGILVSLFSAVSSGLGLFLTHFIQQLAFAYWAIFIVMLTHTISKNPKVPKTA